MRCCRCCFFAHYNQVCFFRTATVVVYNLRFFPHRDSCLTPLLLLLFRHDNRQALSTLTRSHGIMLLLFAHAFVILLMEVNCSDLFMIPVLPLQLLPLTFATAIAVAVVVVMVVVPSLPFLFTLHAFSLYSARQRPFLELS